MRVLKRTLIAFLSAGWLAPLTLSFWATYDFFWNMAWPTVQGANPIPRSPFHLIVFADELFFLSVVWAAVVIMAWSFRLSR